MPEESIQKRFQRLVEADLGSLGVVDLDAMPPFLAERATTALELVRSHLDNYIQRGGLSVDSSTIHVDVFGGAKAEAFAHSVGDDHFIGASLGMMSAIDRIWNALLSAPGQFSTIGSPSRARVGMTLPLSPMSISPQPKTLKELVESLEAMSEAERPECPVRAQFAGEMSAITLAFCLLHEAGHLLGGHTQLHRENQAIGRICELNSDERTIEVHDRPQIARSYGLELLADHYAFEILLLKLQESSFVNEKSASPLSSAWWTEGGNDTTATDAAFAIGAAAAGCLFLLLFAAGTKVSDTHPHPVYRIFWLLQQETHLIKQADGRAPDADIAWSSINSVWTAFRELGLPTMKVPRGEIFDEELDGLQKIVFELRSELTSYSWDSKRSIR